MLTHLMKYSRLSDLICFMGKADFLVDDLSLKEELRFLYYLAFKERSK